MFRWIHALRSRVRPGLVLGIVAVGLASAGSATAATLITGAQIEDESVTGDDIRDGSLYAADLNRGTRAALRGASGKPGATGATGTAGRAGAPGADGTDGADGRDGAAGADGAQGPAGPQGATGPQGPAGDAATFSRLPWGIVGRNTIGSPVAYPRVGPNGRPSGSNAATLLPPYGEGSLGIHVDGVNGSGGTGSSAEKLYFADETTFANLKLADITTLGYWVYTGEDTFTSHALPSIAMEANPDANGATYTTLQYSPDTTGRTVNSWQQFDAMTGARWTTSASLDAGNTCKASACTFTTLLGLLGPNAKVTLSLGFNKGRDNEWTGAIDGLRVNEWVYDFEPEGVNRRTP